MTARDRFLEVYARQLARAVAERPDEYLWPSSEAPIVAARMVEAFVRGSANKEGIAIRRTCAELGIPYTYAGIRGYLEGKESAR